MKERVGTCHQWEYEDTTNKENIVIGSLSSECCKQQHMRLYVPVMGNARDNKTKSVALTKTALLEAVTAALTRDSFKQAKQVTLIFQDVPFNWLVVEYLIQQLQPRTDAVDIVLQSEWEKSPILNLLYVSNGLKRLRTEAEPVDIHIKGIKREYSFLKKLLS